MIEALTNLPAHMRQRLASALRSGLLRPPFSVSAVRAAVDAGPASELTAAVLANLQKLGATGPAIAELLSALDAAAARRPQLDFVWSGPAVAGLHSRNTRRVYDELLGAAERSIWASTYAFFDGPRAFEVLARRMDERPDLQVTLLLNVQRKRGDTSAPDLLVRRFADRLWNQEWPGEVRPRVYYDPRSLEPEGPGGVLHAKAVVADEEVVFVTSANLTEAALDSNVELGVVVRDRALAMSVSTHFRALVDQNLLVRLPSS